MSSDSLEDNFPSALWWRFRMLLKCLEITKKQLGCCSRGDRQRPKCPTSLGPAKSSVLT